MDAFEDTISSVDSLDGWVCGKVEEWKNYVRTNYYTKWDEYERLWRGKWSAEDKTRSSERSRIITPALQQAVESNAAEIEEATFGRGHWFDIEDDIADTDRGDIEALKNLLSEEFRVNSVRRDLGECVVNAAVWGTGIGEVVVDQSMKRKPASQPIMDGALQAIGVESANKVSVYLKPVMPKNFFIDPHATTVDNAMGVAIEEFVSKHSVIQLQEQGVYNDVPLGTSSQDTDLETTINDTVYEEDKVKLTKYFGLIPSELLDEEERDEGYYTESIVVLANDDTILKAIQNPYMMQDRPIVAFQWDVVPSEFWGRGTCEKGYNSQKALDAEIRARIDALALTVHPMLGVDGTKVPRGTDFSVRPGRSIIFTGSPQEAVQPFSFGNVSQITFAQAGELQKMVQQSTGAMDNVGLPQAAARGEGTAAGMSMALGAVIKRHKRTLINFQETMLIPFVSKAAWRYMQFDPENFKVSDYKFVVSGSLGIIAREYETTQLAQLMQSMNPESPLYLTLLTSIIDNMNVSNREKLIAELQKASQPTPEQQAKEQAQQQREQEVHQVQVQLLQGQANEFNAHARKYNVEADLAPKELQAELIGEIAERLPQEDGDKAFERRLKVADLALRAKQGNTNGRN